MRRAPWFLVLLMAGCTNTPPAEPPATELATFGAGCYWCAEAALEQLDGVVDVTSGFMGGADVEAPDGRSLVAAGHVEVVQVEFDPSLLSYDELLTWYWRIHDPTSIDKQGEDSGPEYRSVVFAYGDAQQRTAEASREEAQVGRTRPIVTSIEAASRFYPAVEDQQDYYQRNRQNAHCRTVIAPHLRSVGLDD